MTDYFTHLARRTLGVTTASDPRPVRMPSAAVDWTRPVQLPEGSLAQETEASRAQLVDSLERPVRATAGAVEGMGLGLGTLSLRRMWRDCGSLRRKNRRSLRSR